MDNGQPRQFTQRGEPPQRNCLAMDNGQYKFTVQIMPPILKTSYLLPLTSYIWHV